MDQTFAITVDPSDITLNKDGKVWCKTVDGKFTIRGGAPADGTIEKITEVGTVDGSKITVADATLNWYEKNPSIGRYQDGWWVGVKIVAPASVTDANVGKVTYSNDGTDNLAKSFGTNNDGKTADGKYYMGCWVPVTPEYLEGALAHDSVLTWTYKFDWTGDDSVDQTFAITVDPNDITLNKDGRVWCKTVDGVMTVKEGLVIGHILTKTEAVAATCTTAGNSAYWTCSACNRYYSDAEGTTEIAENSWVIPATGHTLSKTEAVAATCTTAGNSAYWTCSECNKYFSDAEGTTEIAENSWVIPATGHTLNKTEAIAATCTTAGNSAYWTCSACNKYYSDAEGTTEITENSWVISALGHDFAVEFTVDVEATCTEAGSKSKHCSRCDAKTEVTEIPATGHSWDAGVVTTEPTYDAAGVKTYTCSICSQTKTEAIPQLTRPSTGGGGDSSSSTTPSAPTTSTETKPDGSTTTTETKPDGTVTESNTSKPVTDASGNTSQTTTETSTGKDGVTESKTETVTKPDGSASSTTESTTTKPDGTKTESTTETTINKDGSTASTTTSTTTGKDGSKVESKTEATTSTVTNKDGSTTETKLETTTTSTGSKTESTTVTTVNKDGSSTATTTATTTDVTGTVTASKTEVTTKKDGSSTEKTTTTETKASGTVTESKTEVTTNKDGSTKATTTETVTKADGTTTTSKTTATTSLSTNKATGTVTETKKETTTTSDGVKSEGTTVTQIQKDGSVTSKETVKASDSTGTTATKTTTLDAKGNVTTAAEAAVSAKAVAEAAKTGGAVTIPLDVTATKSASTAPTVSVSVPKTAESVKVELPVQNVTPGTVAVIVNADGTEKIVSTSMVTENGVALTLDGSATVKLVDNSKSFKDVPETNVFYNEIASLSAREIMIGKTGDKFDLYNTVTLDQIANVAGRITGAVDVKDFSAGVTWGKNGGLKTGNVSATRGDVLKALYVAAGAPAVEDTSILAKFKDASGIPADMAAIAAWAAQNGILKGNVDGTAGLGNNVTRGQACALAGRTMGTLA